MSDAVMPEGVIAGGWSYVIAAYSVTAIGLSVYIWSLVSRSRKPGDES